MHVSIPIPYTYTKYIHISITTHFQTLNQPFKIDFNVSFNRWRHWQQDLFLQWLNKAQLRSIRGANPQNQDDLITRVMTFPGYNVVLAHFLPVDLSFFSKWISGWRTRIVSAFSWEQHQFLRMAQGSISRKIIAFILTLCVPSPAKQNRGIKIWY